MIVTIHNHIPTKPRKRKILSKTYTVYLHSTLITFSTFVFAQPNSISKYKFFKYLTIATLILFALHNDNHIVWELYLLGHFYMLLWYRTYIHIIHYTTLIIVWLNVHRMLTHGLFIPNIRAFSCTSIRIYTYNRNRYLYTVKCTYTYTLIYVQSIKSMLSN